MHMKVRVKVFKHKKQHFSKNGQVTEPKSKAFSKLLFKITLKYKKEVWLLGNKM